MNCTTCGAEVQAAATFCHQCGAPIRPGAAVAVAVEESPIRFTLEAGALEIFGRALLAAFCSIFVVPIPWILP
jgi:hypothetical protein